MPIYGNSVSDHQISDFVVKHHHSQMELARIVRIRPQWILENVQKFTSQANYAVVAGKYLISEVKPWCIF